METARTVIPALALTLTATVAAQMNTSADTGANQAVSVSPAAVATHDHVHDHDGDSDETAVDITRTPDARLGRLVVFVDTAAQLEDVRWAVGRFADAGLDLPAGDLHMHRDPADCARPDGSARNAYMGGGSDGFALHICTNSSVLLHELAHLWDNHAMTDELRDALLDLRGLDTWRHEEWGHAGGEHLASIIAWGLGGGRPSRIAVAGNPSAGIDDASLASAYELVTGSQPLALTERGLELRDGKVARVAVAAAPAPTTAPDSVPVSDPAPSQTVPEAA